MLEAIFAGPWGPLVIFCLRIIDVSMATLRMLLAVRRGGLVVPLIGFFEIMIWILAVGSAIKHLDSPLYILAYAGGFATGSYVGLWLEERLAMGLASIQIISRVAGIELAEALRERGFGVTELLGQGREGRVEVIQTVVRRRDAPAVLGEVDQWDPDAFVSVEEPRAIRKGWMFSARRK